MKAEYTKYLHQDAILQLKGTTKKDVLALPHVRVVDFPSPLVIVGVCTTPIADYKTLDGAPVELIVFLAADEKEQEAYLKILGSMSCKLKNKEIVASVIAAGDDKEKIYSILTEE